MTLKELLTKYPDGKFRKARKVHKCDYIESGTYRPCQRPIARDEIYYDPRQAKDLRKGHYETLRICAYCAGIPVSMPQCDLFVTAPVESKSQAEKRKE
jgi:hypothetical protein